ncbi:Fic family protein, partial [Candidatus Woesearchaeota archaeon]
NGRHYWYIHDNIYISKGKTQLVVKYLCPVERATKELLAAKQQAFKLELEAEEARLRTAYWTKTQKHQFFSDDKVQEIESLRTKLYRAKERLPPISKAALDMAFITDFIYNSNKLEGSKLPRSTVQEILNKGVANNEVAYTAAAKEYIDTKFDFTIKKLEKAHAILLTDEPRKQGIRKEPITVGDDETLVRHERIRPLLQELFSWCVQNYYTLYPIELAFLFYFRFERIHPFTDGNGRIGRLIMNKILKETRYHPIIIWNSNRQAHFTAFKRAANDGHLLPFYRFMLSQYKKTYKTYLKKIEPAEDFEKLVTFFLSPSE